MGQGIGATSSGKSQSSMLVQQSIILEDTIMEMILLKRFHITLEESRRCFREMKWSREMDPDD